MAIIINRPINDDTPNPLEAWTNAVLDRHNGKQVNESPASTVSVAAAPVAACKP